MTTYLLDINVLMALAWPHHVHHGCAHTWLAGHHPTRWATCPMTQAAFIRLSCNPRVVGRSVAPQDAIHLLNANTALPGHEFWADEITVAEAFASLRGRVLGHQQITDGYLLGLAIHKKGILATLDHRMAHLVPEDSHAREALEIIAI